MTNDVKTRYANHAFTLLRRFILIIMFNAQSNVCVCTSEYMCI